MKPCLHKSSQIHVVRLGRKRVITIILIFSFFAGVFADGPGAYLFHGVVEQQYVFHVMDYALCLSESKQKSCEKHVNRGGKPTSKSGALSLSVHSLYSLLLIAISYAVFVALEA